ncbi:ion channel [Streptomyces sp. NPDC005551]|uniref:ion channel n=1 Tax=unclassified Streptomyces TaxID=2593676 RepID=UPI0033E730A6
MDPDSPTARWQRRTELLLTAASLAFLGSYAFLVLAHGASDAWRGVALCVLLAAWAAFAVDYGVRWRLSGRRFGFARSHWLDTLVLVLPLLRPLRIVRIYEAVQHRRGGPRLSLHARVVAYAGLSASLLGFTGALAVYQQERGAPGANMRTFGDALWWACSTLSTVGYGDIVPVTTGGRVVAAAMMACGLGLLGAVTGSFSSWLLQVFARGDEDGPPAR